MITTEQQQANEQLIRDYLAAKFPSLDPDSITDPEMQRIWLARARDWHKKQHSTGFNRAVVEFEKLQGHHVWSTRTTLHHAQQALKQAGVIE